MSPVTEMRETTPHYLAIVIKVGVEPHAVAAGCLEIDEWGGTGVILREIYIELKAPIGIRGVGRTRDENLEGR